MSDSKNCKLCLYALPLYYIYSFANVFISKITNIPLIFNTFLNIIRIIVYIYI